MTLKRNKTMCTELKEAIGKAKNNIETIAEAINKLNISCKFKAAFMKMTDERGFRFDNDTLQMMQIIGQTDSDMCLMLLLDRKQSGLIAAYRLATELKEDSQRAEAIQWLEDNGFKPVEKNILMAILTVR
jgi:hypothetical protein